LGRVTRDSELIHRDTGEAVCSFGITTNEYAKDPTASELKIIMTFVPVVILGEAAESYYKNLKKGRVICLEGSLHTYRWKDADGTEKSCLVVVASKI
jgi:single stranded DNA-binding protein